jgi:hypothetical protein
MNPMLIPASDSIGSYGRSRSIADLSMVTSKNQWPYPYLHNLIYRTTSNSFKFISQYCC